MIVDMNKFTTIIWKDSWEDMPVKAIEYLKRLKEFDPEIFIKITHLDASKIEDKVKISCEGKEVEISRQSAKALNLI